MKARIKIETMSLPNFDDHAYAASDKDGSWLETDWRKSSAFLSKKEHEHLVNSIDVEHSKTFMKSATWGQILENNDLPNDETELRKDSHAWISTYHNFQAQQKPVSVEVTEVMADEHEGPGDSLKQPKSVNSKRSRKKG